MDEETVTTTTSEPEFRPVLPTTSAPEPPPAPDADPAPDQEPSDPVTVVSVEELIDRLVQATQEEDQEDVPPADTEELPEDSDLSGDNFLSEEDPGPLEVKGMDELLEYAEIIQTTLDHPALTTSFQDYTVMEGLLLLILLAAFAAACVRILKGGFQWLRW